MSVKKIILNKKTLFTVISVISIVGYGFFVFAAPPGAGGYAIGETLDPECTPGQTIPNPCIVAGGLSYGGLATIGHDNEVLYLDSSGNVASDVSFTRDSVTNHTNVSRQFDSAETQYVIDTATQVQINSSTGQFLPGETINDIDSGASAIVQFQSGISSEYIFLTNIVGTINGSDNLSGATSGTTAVVDQVYPSTISDGQTVVFFDPSTGNPTGQGTIISSTGNTYALSIQIGTIDNFYVMTDNNGNYLGIYTLNTNILTNPVETGFKTDDNYAGFGIQGSYFHQSDGITSMDFGVFDLSGLGGTRTTAGIVSVDQSTGAATTLIVNPYGQGLSLGSQDSLGNRSDFFLGQESFTLSSELNGMGGSSVGFSANGITPAWFGNGNTFHLPTYTPAQDQVLSVSSVSGNEIYLDWVNAGTGSNPWSAYTVPADGTLGQILSTDGSGILSWIDAGGVFPDQTNHDGEFLTTNSGILSWTSNIGSYVPLSYMGANNGVATLDANGKIPSSQLAALAINNSFVVGSEVDMLALPANTGDIVVRTDISSTFVLSGSDPTILSNWVQLLWQPTVVSINGLAGVVNLITDNINEGTTNLYFTNSRVNTAITAYLPTQTGNSGRVLSTDGAGNLSWVTQSGGGGIGTGPIYTNSVASLFTSDIGAGEGSTLIGGNIFFGYSAGNGATSVSYSNFFGQNSGNSAVSASNSNFFGYESGFGAENAANSNFFGNYAGHYATDASNSNFFGQNSGNGASGAFNSNFFGQNSGSGASSAYNSNFFGRNSGSNATGAHDSNLFGESAGYQADNAYYANFIGYAAGYQANQAYYSNFFGHQAGYGATSADHSNFLGTNTGLGATNAGHANFFGTDAGYGALAANNANFFGNAAGYQAMGAYKSNFFGFNAGYNASDAYESNFSGNQAGYNASSAYNSNFFGTDAGNSASDARYANFFGNSAGYGADSAEYSNFFGYQAGYLATNAAQSNFMGTYAGKGAADVLSGNFIGNSAGYGAIDADFSNFIGSSAGYNATDATYSNFFGQSAGNGATYASYSFFVGLQAGYNAENANNSVFLGNNAGNGAINASNSIFIGQYAGLGDSAVDNTATYDDITIFADTSILLGYSTHTGGFSNSIAIGAYAGNTASNEFMIGSTRRPINTTIWKGAASTECTLTTGTGISCTSDERLKTNITDLQIDTLDKLLSIRTVTYNWLENPTSKKQIGFLAQNLEQYFPELVATNDEGKKSVYYAQMTPILVEAIREMNLKIITINDMETPNTWRDALTVWFGNVSNGITKLFADEIETKTLCVSDNTGDKTCITKVQLDQLLSGSVNGSITPAPAPSPDLTPDPDQNPTPDTNPGTDNTDPGTSDVSSDTPIDSGNPPAGSPAPSSDPGPVVPTE